MIKTRLHAGAFARVSASANVLHASARCIRNPNAVGVRAAHPSWDAAPIRALFPVADAAVDTHVEAAMLEWIAVPVGQTTVRVVVALPALPIIRWKWFVRWATGVDTYLPASFQHVASIQNLIDFRVRDIRDSRIPKAPPVTEASTTRLLHAAIVTHDFVVATAVTGRRADRLSHCIIA